MRYGLGVWKLCGCCGCFEVVGVSDSQLTVVVDDCHDDCNEHACINLFHSIHSLQTDRHRHTHTHTQTHTHRHTHTDTHTDCMSSNVVKKRINAAEGLADYTGTVNSDGAPHGRGSYLLVEGGLKGSICDGTFVNGKLDGCGKATWSDDGRVDAGEWKADRLHGFGKVCCVCESHSQCFR